MKKTPYGSYPSTRLRRPRANDWSRRLHQETSLQASDLIWPVFVIEGENKRESVSSMPGVERLSPDLVVKAALEAAELSIPAMAIFPYTKMDDRSPRGDNALNDQNLVCQTIRAIKASGANIGIIADVALDPYTDHGHDGILHNGEIINDETIDILTRQAVVQAQAGCDIIAPSDMMDGRVGAIRAALDESGFEDRQIMSYAVKYASAFYGPFRDAIGSSGTLKGDKRTYQMNPANRAEALREAALDLAEGADSLIVKPGGPYLDIIREVKDAFAAPTFAYQVSGEYAMIMAAAKNGWLDEEAAMLESLIALKRAGADGILTYFAPRVARLLQSAR